jgi:nucleotide-binding universal stress UspA family protein
MVKRILIPTDFSEPSRAAVKYALELAAAVGGRIILLHVVEGSPDCIHAVGGSPGFPTDYINPDGDLSFRFRPLPRRIIRRDLCEEAHWKLAMLFSPGYRDHVRTVVTVGKPADEIVRVAREHGADLIMLGSAGRRGLRRLLRRTVADKVMRRARIPVIALNAHDPGLERAPGRSDAPYPSVEGDHADFQADEQVRTAKAMARSRSRPGAPIPSSPKGVESGAEDPMLPPVMPFKRRVGQHTTKRSRTMNP